MVSYYIGGFPPPYGGVTVKNRNLCTALGSHTELRKIDLSRIKQKDLREALRLIWALTGPGHRFILGVTGTGTRRRFTHLVYCVNRRAMRRSVLMLMGGTVADQIAADPRYRRWASQYGKMYAETRGMIRVLNGAGLTNAAYYPNGRFRPRAELPLRENTDRPLECVFFSQISREKGADLVLRAAEALPGVRFAFYGHILPDFREEFEASLRRLPNVRYAGVFSGESEAVYQELAGYDVMLLPTTCQTEGVPGVLVEAKIAGLTAVVSNAAYNCEIVHNGSEGIVLKENTSEVLAEALRRLDADRGLLFRLKQGSRCSAQQYYIEQYVPQILSDLEALL